MMKSIPRTRIPSRPRLGCDKNLEAKVDSIANQINGFYVEKDQSMIQYLEKAKMLINSFRKFLIEQVSRSEHKKADALSKIASTSFAHLTKQVLVEVLKEKSIEEREVLAMSLLEPWLRCIVPLQAEYLIREIHEGSCSMHSGPRSVVAKAIRSGYYWPTMHKDARNIIRKCDDYQVHRPVTKNPQHKLTPITFPWPFYKWGIDISGSFPEAQKKVERANRSLGEGIKARLGEENKNGVEEVPHVMWAHRTTIKTSNGHTSFSLTYNTEAVIPVKISVPSLRCATIDQAMNDEALLLNLDILEEGREKAAIQEAKSKAKMEKYYNAKVRSTTFKQGDFVYRNNEANHAKEGEKLDPKWEGPYEIVEVLRKGAYKIRNDSGDILPRTWNVKDLKKCYI
ncbi:reverse transcriptase domain-containing protein [Tanacetum coccineum]